MHIFGEQFIFFNFLHGNLKVNRTVELETIHHKFLVDMYMHPNVKVLKICTFCTKICYLIKNYVHHGKKQLHQEVEDGYIIVKHSDTCVPPATELIDMVEKHNTLITINCGTYFCILEFCIQSM